MSGPGHIAIVGAGASGANAVRSLCALDYAGKITLIDADPAGSYERPPLSKAGLLNAHSRPEDFALLSREDIDRFEIEAVYGDPAVSLSPSEMLLRTQSGWTVSADRILLATGGAPRRLNLEGAHADGVFTLRDFSDLEKLRERLPRASRIAVIGGGLIGAECVAGFLQLGKQVLWIDAASAPLTHVLPEPLAGSLVTKHVAAGATLLADAKIAAFETDRGSVSAVRMSDGTSHAADLVLLGVGMTPRLALAEAAGLALDDGGVRVDARQETSARHIYAAGDIAATPSGGGWRRHEHWRAAETQGDAAAHAMLELPYEAPDASWFWSDQGDHHVEMTGRTGQRSVLRLGEKALASFEFDDGRLVGAASLNDPNAVRVAMRLMKSGKTPPESALADPKQDLRQLLRA